MKRIHNWIERWLDACKLKKKLIILYVCCVLIPLVVTDGVLVYIAIRTEAAEQQHSMEKVASAVQYNLNNSIELIDAIAKNIYTNEYIEEYLNRKYASKYDYVVAYHDFMKATLLHNGIGMENSTITLYADNDTIINGGGVGRMSAIENTEWYQAIEQSKDNAILYFYYDKESVSTIDVKRKIVYVRRLDYFGNRRCKKILKIEFDYNNMIRNMTKMNYNYPVYICLGDNIVLSNDEHNSASVDFEPFRYQKEVGYRKAFSIYGVDLQINVLRQKFNFWSFFADNFVIILIMVLISVLLPWLLMREINISFTRRFEMLSDVFESVDKEQLKRLEQIDGNDEITKLMTNYNKMVDKTNDLIQTIFKDRIREQEMDIARQNAELLALHSQINPHFLFNTLESIRMHSIIRHEYETAQMVEKLAIMERQNVDWSTDAVEIQKEMEFIEAYLALQKYRFGDRLFYSLEVEPECKNILLPKLSIVTFVENACVHGIESKTSSGWIFVRIFNAGNQTIIEVEDTGEGLVEEEIQSLQTKMQDASLAMLKEKGRVGIVNACLRLKMMTNNQVEFAVDSEVGVGTTIQIKLPLKVEEERC